METEWNGNTIQPIYNGAEGRVGQTVDGQTTNYALALASGSPEVIYTSPSEVYLHLPSVIVTQKATEVRYLLSDGLGSICHAVDETGAVIAYHSSPTRAMTKSNASNTLLMARSSPTSARL